jgi:hypothetical protein
MDATTIYMTLISIKVTTKVYIMKKVFKHIPMINKASKVHKCN